jgi:hypothetical protein
MSNTGIIKGISVEGIYINKGISRPRPNDVDGISEKVPNILDEPIQTQA